MNTSIIGWGTHMGSHAKQGIGTPWEVRMPIHLLELKAICLACNAFLPVTRFCHIQSMTETMMIVFYINKQGRAQSLLLCTEAVSLWKWYIRNHVTFSAIHLPGAPNLYADNLSQRINESSRYWEHHPGTIRHLQPSLSSAHRLLFGWASDLDYSCLEAVLTVLKYSRRDSTREYYLVK